MPWTYLTYVDRAWLSAQLSSEEARFSQAVANGQWRAEFSGKQIFHRLSGYVHTKGTGKAKHTDLLQAVIDKQVKSATLSSELRDLRSSLRVRVGLPP